MRRVWRSLLLLATLVFVGASAHAAFPANTLEYSTGTYNNNGAGASGWRRTKDEACAAGVARILVENTNFASVTLVECGGLFGGTPSVAAGFKVSYVCKTSCTTGNLSFGIFYRSAAAACPVNSTLSGSTCSCNTNYEQNAAGNACQLIQTTCNAGDTINSGYYDAGTSIAGGPPAVVCQAGCMATFDGTFPAGNAMVGGVKHYFAKGSYVKFGSKCDSGAGVGVPGGAGNGPPAVAAVPPDSCGPGKVMGTVNDKPVCGDAGNGTTTPTPNTPETSTDTKKESSTTTSTANPDGGKTTTTTTTTTGVDGGITTRTTITVTGSDGSVKSTETTETGAEVKKEAEELEREKCDKNAADEGCGGDPSDVEASGLYTKKEKTVASIFEGAKTTLQASPVGSATSNFFTVSGGGSCPTATWTIPYLNASVQMDAFCTPMALNMLFAIKGALLLVASFMAFRIAVE